MINEIKLCCPVCSAPLNKTTNFYKVKKYFIRTCKECNSVWEIGIPAKCDKDQKIFVTVSNKKSNRKKEDY